MKSTPDFFNIQKEKELLTAPKALLKDKRNAVSRC